MMWCVQFVYFEFWGCWVIVVDLFGYGSCMDEDFFFYEVLYMIDFVVCVVVEDGFVLFVGYLMGGLLLLVYMGGVEKLFVVGFVVVVCILFLQGVGFVVYCLFVWVVDVLLDCGMWFIQWMFVVMILEEYCGDFVVGGYVLDIQDLVLWSLVVFDIVFVVVCIDVLLWFVNGQYDQL